MVEIIKPQVKHIVPSAGYFEITKYNSEGKSSKYRLLDQLTPPMDQDKLAEFYEKAKKNGNPAPLNSIQMIEFLEDVAMSGNNELKNYVHDCIRNNWLNTLSRVIYNPIGQKDETVHNYATSDAYSIIGDIVGRDGFIKEINNLNALESILKTKDIKKLNEISNEINKTLMYFWRFNSKPDKKIEAVVGFDADVGRLDLGATRYLSVEGPAFLVDRIK